MLRVVVESSKTNGVIKVSGGIKINTKSDINNQHFNQRGEKACTSQAHMNEYRRVIRRHTGIIVNVICRIRLDAPMHTEAHKGPDSN